MDPENTAVMAQHMQITKYVDAAGFVFLLYDHILTFDDEVRLVWSADTTLPKVLFLINRYFVPSAMIFRTNDSSGLARIKLSDTFCKFEMNISLFVAMISIAVSNLLVLLRIWVLWERNRRLMAWTGAAFLVAQIAAFTVCSVVVSRLTQFLVYDPNYFACILTEKDHFTIATLWIPGLAFEILVFVVVWWNALDRPRQQSDVIFSQVLFREGTIYFLVLFSLRVLNLVLGIVAPVSLIFVGMVFIWCASTMTTSHLILSLRKLSVDGPQGDGADIQRTNFQLPSADFFELGSVNTEIAIDSKT